MKLPDDDKSAPPSGDAPFRKRSASVDLSAGSNAARSGSLDATEFPVLRRNDSWLQLFVRRSSADFSIGGTLSPAQSLESISSCADDQPRSRNSSGDVMPASTNRIGGLIGDQTEQRRLAEKSKVDSASWAWKLVNARLDKNLRIRKISEMDEADGDLKKASSSDLTKASISQSAPSFLKMATKITARDLNAISPSGDI